MQQVRNAQAHATAWLHEMRNGRQQATDADVIDLSAPTIPTNPHSSGSKTGNSLPPLCSAHRKSGRPSR
ncbi:hypothetical protein, partial [Mesorhizobium sp. dw_380]|uniref:hypothetical protein n=1 Tax=Mesorhizobium sp. dw_380 TaxID=2812001 RepID=UPI001BDE7DBB